MLPSPHDPDGRNRISTHRPWQVGHGVRRRSPQGCEGVRERGRYRPLGRNDGLPVPTYGEQPLALPFVAGDDAKPFPIGAGMHVSGVAFGAFKLAPNMLHLIVWPESGYQQVDGYHGVMAAAVAGAKDVYPVLRLDGDKGGRPGHGARVSEGSLKANRTPHADASGVFRAHRVE